MKRVILITLTTLSIAAGAMLAPTAAFATPTCTIHDLQITAWGIADDHVDTSWDLKCGGATNSPWDVGLYLQYQQADGSWHTYGCSNGNLCETQRPIDGSEYGGGSRHSGTNTWNPATNIDCDTIRFHAVAGWATGFASSGAHSAPASGDDAR